MKSIPQFYIGKFSDKKLEIRDEFLKKKREELASLNTDAYRTLMTLLLEFSEPKNGEPNLDGKTISYQNYRFMLTQTKALPDLLRKYLTPVLFTSLPQNEFGLAYSDILFTFAFEIRSYFESRLICAEIDYDNNGYLRESQMVEFCAAFTSQLVPQQNQATFYAVMVRKFMFFLGSKQVLENKVSPYSRISSSISMEKRIKIKDLIISGVLKEFRRSIRQPLDISNWFSQDNIITVYHAFSDLDFDRNDFLSRDEFNSFRTRFANHPCITRFVVDRIFECKITRSSANPNGELDFRNFLDFYLAFTNKDHDASFRYYWTLLDFHQVGYLDAHTLHTFLREIFSCLQYENPITVQDVANEIFDMATPREDSSRISFQDLYNCKLRSLIIILLTDPNGFHNYETREQQLAQTFQQEEEYYPPESYVEEFPQQQGDPQSISQDDQDMDNIENENFNQEQDLKIDFGEGLFEDEFSSESVNQINFPRDPDDINPEDQV